MQVRTTDFAAQADLTYNEPVLLVRIILQGSTQYLATRTGTFDGRDYQGLLKDGVTVSFGYDNFGRPQRNNGRLAIINADDGTGTRFSDLFNTETFDNAAIQIDQTFVGLAGGNALPVFRGVIEVPPDAIDDEEVRLIFKDDGNPVSPDRIDLNNTMLNKLLGTLITPAANPAADISDYGKMQPIIYGLVRNSPCPSYSVGAADVLREDLTATATDRLVISDKRRWDQFPTSSFYVMVDDEIILVGAKSVQGGDLVLTNLTRGISTEGSVTAGTGTAHAAGRVVFLKRNYYDFVVADHPVTNVTNVRVNGHGKTPGTKWSDQGSWVAGNYDNGYNWINGNPTIIRFYSRRPGRIPDLSANNFGKHNHPGQNHIVQIPLTPSLPVQGTNPQEPLAWPQDFKILPGSTGILHIITGVIVSPDAWKVQNASGDILFSKLISQADLWVTDPRPTNGITTITYDGTGINAGHTFTFIERNINAPFTGDDTSPYSSKTGEELTPNVTCDVEGYQDDSAGTYTGRPNTVITNPADIVQHIVGVRLASSLATYIDTPSFTQARTDFNTAVIRADFGLYAQIDSATLLEQLREAVAARLYLNAAGKFRMLVLPLTNTDVRTTAYSEVQDIVHPRTGGNVVRIGRTPISDLYNRIIMPYKRDYTNGNYQATQDVQDVPSQTLYRTINTWRFNNDFIQNDDSAAAVANKYLSWYKTQHWIATMVVFGLPNLHIEPGDRIKLTSARMPGTWNAKDFFPETIRKSLSRGSQPDTVEFVSREA